MMCVLKYMEMEDYEWHDQDDIDIDGLEVPKETVVENGTLVMPVGARQPVWCEDSS